MSVLIASCLVGLLPASGARQPLLNGLLIYKSRKIQERDVLFALGVESCGEARRAEFQTWLQILDDIVT